MSDTQPSPSDTSTDVTGRGRRRLVLVGAGHAHLYTIHRTARIIARGHEVVLVAPERFWYSGLATGVLGGRYEPSLDQIDVGTIVRSGGGALIPKRVKAIEPDRSDVILEDGTPLRYDVLSLAIGSEPPPIPGTDDHPRCYPVKPIPRLVQLRADLEAAFSEGKPVRVVVGGGGATAVELATNIAGLAARRGGSVDLRMLAGTDPLRQLPEGARAPLIETLSRRGIAFEIGTRVERVDGDRVVTQDGRSVPFDVFVNAIGLRPNPLLRTSGLPVDDHGALCVDTHLRSTADARVHGAGDCVAIDGHALDRVGVYAIRQAPILYANLLAALDGTAPQSFRPQQRYLWIMNLGDSTGLAAYGSRWWHGRMAFHLKDWIDRRFLDGQRA